MAVENGHQRLDFVSGQTMKDINDGLASKYIYENSFDNVDDLSKHMFPAVFSSITHCLSALRKHPRYKNLEFIWAGSTAEGVNVPEMDKNVDNSVSLEFEIDILCVLKDIQIGRTFDSPAILMMQKDTTFGYFLVYMNDPGYRQLWYDCCIKPTSPTRRDTELYLNPLKLVEDLYKQIEHIYNQISVMKERFVVEFNPPAVTMTLKPESTSPVKISCDLVVALEIPYSVIPDSYPLWLGKSKKPDWLSDSAMKDIQDCCLHLVGKQSPLGQPRTEWRLSFNRVELIFFKTLKEKCPIAVTSYRILKLIRRWHLREPKILPSYFLKMIFFKACHRLSVSVWTEDSIAECVLGLLDDVIHSLATKKLASFFIPDYNLLEGKHSDFTETLVSKLINVRKDPIENILNVRR